MKRKLYALIFAAGFAGVALQAWAQAPGHGMHDPLCGAAADSGEAQPQYFSAAAIGRRGRAKQDRTRGDARQFPATQSGNSGRACQGRSGSRGACHACPTKCSSRTSRSESRLVRHGSRFMAPFPPSRRRRCATRSTRGWLAWTRFASACTIYIREADDWQSPPTIVLQPVFLRAGVSNPTPPIWGWVSFAMTVVVVTAG